MLVSTHLENVEKNLSGRFVTKDQLQEFKLESIEL